MEYRRINPHPSLPSPSSHTHPGSSPETIQPLAFTGIHLQSHWAPCAFTGMHPQINPQSKYPPQPFLPIPDSVLYYISYKRQHDPVCVLTRCGVQSSGIFVALWLTRGLLVEGVTSAIYFDLVMDPGHMNIDLTYTTPFFFSPD